ncbi:hypothetical protein K1T71_014970 [Dendrolimus kikuchii]|nr:hypothetical protein K1T71_014970 [Dendrolimus kikuchii]
MSEVEEKPVFRDLTGEDSEPEVTEIESLCINCHSNRNYNNLVCMCFSLYLRVESHVDLNRQVVKSDYTSLRIPELDFEIPAKSQKGEVTTVEGIVTRAIAGLTQDQEARRSQHPGAADQIDVFVSRLQELRDGKRWTLEVEDISGNTFIENPEAPKKDPRCERVDFKRTKEQNHTLGIFMHDEVSGEPTPSTPHFPISDSLLTPMSPDECSYDQLSADEVLRFRTNCPDCNAPADTNMKITSKFTLLFVKRTTCVFCGLTERGGGDCLALLASARFALLFSFFLSILLCLRSETCRMEIPELELEVGGNALGGRFTTAEGLIRATADQLSESPGVVGDAPGINNRGLEAFIERLNAVLDCKSAITIILDDPAGNSYVQSLAEDPTMPDEGLKITRYERTYEQNEELGLNDIKTENYEAL